MYIRLRTSTTLFLLIYLLSLSVTVSADETDCLLQNDQLVKLNPLKGLLEQHQQNWLSLSEKCPDSPYVLHNLGVVNAKLGLWDKAASYFKNSLESEPRSQQSYQHLSSIYRYQAVTAYREALQSNSPAPKKPSFKYQLSTLHANEQLASPKPRSEQEALVENWLAEKRPNLVISNPKYWLNSNSSTPFAVIHTSQHSYILEFIKTQNNWQILQEHVVP